jgi:hypothetical protein
LIGRTRADLALSAELESAVRQQIAARLVRYTAGDRAPVASSDAAWMQAEIARWLDGALAAGPGVVSITDPGFTGTLVAAYGPTAPGTALRVMPPDATLDAILSPVLGISLPLLTVEQLNALSWLSFFEWRLALETQLLGTPEGGGAFMNLYDLENMTAASLANQRQEDPAYTLRADPQVVSLLITRDELTQTFATAETVRLENNQEVRENVSWRLAGGTWKRAN